MYAALHLVNQIVLPTDRCVVYLGRERNGCQKNKMFLTGNILGRNISFYIFITYLSLMSICVCVCACVSTCAQVNVCACLSMCVELSGKLLGMSSYLLLCF